MRAVQDYLERVWGEAAARFRLLAENTRSDPRRMTGPLRISFEVSCPAPTPSPRGPRGSDVVAARITRSVVSPA